MPKERIERYEKLFEKLDEVIQYMKLGGQLQGNQIQSLIERVGDIERRLKID